MAKADSKIISIGTRVGQFLSKKERYRPNVTVPFFLGKNGTVTLGRFLITQAEPHAIGEGNRGDKRRILIRGVLRMPPLYLRVFLHPESPQ